MPRPSFHASADTRLIMQELEKVAIGDTITFKQLSAAVSRPKNEIRSNINSARAALLRDHQIVFDNVRGVGYKRLTDAETVESTTQDIAKTRRAARRGLIKIASVQDYSSLSARDQLAHSTRAAVLGAVTEITSGRGVKRVEKAASGKAGDLPFKETVQAFLK